jgi:hypothetical protein
LSRDGVRITRLVTLRVFALIAPLPFALPLLDRPEAARTASIASARLRSSATIRPATSRWASGSSSLETS